jgi:hypothetical protein
VVKNDLDRYSLSHRVLVDINGHAIPLAPFELQIAYKLGMGSEKDLEDARQLSVPAARLREVGL